MRHNVAGSLFVLLITSGVSLEARAQQLCGDCDGDGVVSYGDAQLAAQHAATPTILGARAQQRCNVHNPSAGVIDILDALQIAQAASPGSTTTLTCQQTRQCGDCDGDFDVDDADINAAFAHQFPALPNLSGEGFIACDVAPSGGNGVIDGTVTTPLSDVGVIANGVTNGSAVIGCGLPQVCGDCNGDRFVDEQDAQLIADYAVGLISLTGTQLMACDVNQDGAVTVLDSLWVQQAYADPGALSCGFSSPSAPSASAIPGGIYCVADDGNGTDWSWSLRLQDPFYAPPAVIGNTAAIAPAMLTADGLASSWAASISATATAMPFPIGTTVDAVYPGIGPSNCFTVYSVGPVQLAVEYGGGTSCVLAQGGACAFNPDLVQISSTLDLDEDGLYDLLEYGKGTDPDKPDSDGDGILDGFDKCPTIPSGQPPPNNASSAVPTQADGDSDGVGDECDSCPQIGVPQYDIDKDGCESSPYDLVDHVGRVVTGLTITSAEPDKSLLWAHQALGEFWHGGSGSLATAVEQLAAAAQFIALSHLDGGLDTALASALLDELAQAAFRLAEEQLSIYQCVINPSVVVEVHGWLQKGVLLRQGGEVISAIEIFGGAIAIIEQASGD